MVGSGHLSFQRWAAGDKWILLASQPGQIGDLQHSERLYRKKKEGGWFQRLTSCFHLCACGARAATPPQCTHMHLSCFVIRHAHASEHLSYLQVKFGKWHWCFYNIHAKCVYIFNRCNKLIFETFQYYCIFFTIYSSMLDLIQCFILYSFLKENYRILFQI